MPFFYLMGFRLDGFRLYRPSQIEVFMVCV